MCAGAFLLSGCNKAGTEATAPDADAVAVVGQNTLTVSQLSKDIPAGLSTEDSLRYVKAYVKEWVESRLISDIASRDLDMAEIDRITEDYRRRLIMMEYCRRMFRSPTSRCGHFMRAIKMNLCLTVPWCAAPISRCPMM